MRTITNTYNVYKFEELTKDAQRDAIEKWYESDDRSFKIVRV